MAPDKSAPPAPDSKAGENPGYAEPEPRDKDDARQPHPRKKPNPDEGGMEREPERDPGAADD
ncbi:MAG: hypothetical protein ACREO4_11270 [Lysobacter sp.]